MKVFVLFLFFASLPLAGSSEPPPCYRELELNFFRPNLVNETFSMHSISQSNWSLILAELQRNVRKVPELVNERAKKMDPNPLGPAFHPKEASELLRQVLLEVFSGTLAEFQVTNQEAVVEMFHYIYKKQSHRFIACFGQEGLME